ncbi:MAG TPA: SIMPL domain-containing protein [Gaiellales bacterium]|jgi:uncharacterized protein YggE|nr:SIMPL domain-containing protein [Gaiellales bacterium]
MSDLRHLVNTAAVAVLVVAAYAAIHDGGGGRALASGAARRSGALQPFMRFSGHGTVTLRPDQATITFSTHGRGTSLAAAQARASATMRALMAKLRSDGVAARDLRTENVEGGKARPRTATFVASQTLVVTVRDTSLTGKLLADGAAEGARSAYGPSFSISHRRAVYAAAVRAAVADARSKAAAASAAAGLHLTGVVSVNEVSQPPVYFAQALSAEGRAVAPVPVARGTQQVSASVTVVFAYAA